MLGLRLLTLFTIARLTLVEQVRTKRLRDDEGSHVVELVLGIALTVALVLAAYAIFNSKILAKINSVDLG